MKIVGVWYIKRLFKIYGIHYTPKLLRSFMACDV